MTGLLTPELRKVFGPHAPMFEASLAKHLRIGRAALQAQHDQHMAEIKALLAEYGPRVAALESGEVHREA